MKSFEEFEQLDELFGFGEKLQIDPKNALNVFNAINKNLLEARRLMKSIDTWIDRYAGKRKFRKADDLVKFTSDIITDAARKAKREIR